MFYQWQYSEACISQIKNITVFNNDKNMTNFKRIYPAMYECSTYTPSLLQCQ